MLLYPLNDCRHPAREKSLPEQLLAKIETMDAFDSRDEAQFWAYKAGCLLDAALRVAKAFRERPEGPELTAAVRSLAAQAEAVAGASPELVGMEEVDCPV